MTPRARGAEGDEEEASHPEADFLMKAALLLLSSTTRVGIITA